MQFVTRLALAVVSSLLSVAVVFAAAPASTASRVSIESDAASVHLDYDLSGVEKSTATVDGGEYIVNAIPEEGITYEYGQPVLPAVSRWVVVPPTAGLELIVSSDTPRIEQADGEPLICTDSTATDAPLAANMVAGKGVYPPELAIMSEPMIMRGVRMVLVTTYPVHYDYANHTYQYYDRISTEIKYTDDPPVNPVEEPVRRNRSAQFVNVIKNLAVNGDDVGRDDPVVTPEHVGHYLVVINSNLLQYVSPFVEWRRKSGWKVDIYSAPNGVAVGTVQNEIQNRYTAYKNAGTDPFDLVMIIGDRPDGSGYGAPIGSTIPVNGNTDYSYALLEGGDNLLDVGISRWAAGSADLMGLNLGKTLGYEATPNMNDRSWFTRGGCLSSHWGNSEFQAWNITVNTNARWGAEVLEKVGFKDIVFFEDYTYDQVATRVGPVYRDLLNNGSSLILCRAELYYWRNSAQNINPNPIGHPIDVASSGHGEWATWWITRSGNANSLMGPVAKTCTWASNQTGPNSIVFLEMTRGIVFLGMTYGWGRAFTLASMKTIYGNNLNTDQSLSLFDMYGDPGIQPWLGVPEEVTADYPAAVTPNMRTALVHVTDKDDGYDIAGAQVTAYAPGSMPAFNSPDYATYNGMQMWTLKTDSAGLARFVFPEGTKFVANTDMLFTVTGRKIVPFFGKSTIKAQTAPEIASYTLNEAEGDGNNKINPGEKWELSIKAANAGNAGSLAGLKATVSSLSKYFTVDDNVINFGDVAANSSANGDKPAVLHFGMGCPDAASRPDSKPTVLVEFAAGAGRWSAAIQLSSQAPNLEVKSVVGGNIVVQDNQNHDLNIELANVGSIATDGGISATLKSLGFALQVSNRTAAYPKISPGGSSQIQGAKFSIVSSKDAVPGMMNDMVLILRADNGFVDSAFFRVQVGQPGANKPGGPDNYGYIVFDDTDNGWDARPNYNWVEISTKENNRDFDGTSCNFDGQADDPYKFNTGQTIVVPLRFKTQFYGYVYDSISICSNGFISVGNQPKIINYDNWPMDQAMAGGVGMIAPFWDKLRLIPANGNVYYYYDEDSARFIVEWYKLQHFTSPQTDLIFEAILYDKDVWKTTAGDTKIVFQYRSIQMAQNVGGGQTPDQAWVSDNPYASVGISSPDGNSGLSYTFGNVFPVTSAVIQNQRALLFLTTPKVKLGIIYGTVTDAENGHPLSNALISTTNGQEVRTDDDGVYRIPEAVAELVFDLTASAVGYNDSTVADTIVAEDDSIEVNFGLLHPHFRSSTKAVSAVMDVDMESDFDFSVSNEGNGPLNWRLNRKLPGNADVDPWQRRESFPVGLALGCSRVQGVVWVDGKFVVAAGGRTSNDPNMIYIMEKTDDGIAATDSFRQSVTSRLGMYDLAYDGNLIWGTDDDSLIGFTIQGEVKVQLPMKSNYLRGITWDAKDSLLIVCGRTANSDMFAVDIAGNVVSDFGQVGFSKTGLAYWPSDPDGYYLYMFHDDGTSMIVHKKNLETGDTLFVAKIIPPEGGLAEGVFITNKYDVYSWVFICIVNGTTAGRYDDRIDLWQIEARRDWFKVFLPDDMQHEVSSGKIDAGEKENFRLRLNSSGLPQVPFAGILQFVHNAMSQADTIKVNLDVISYRPPAKFNIQIPADKDTVDMNDSTKVKFAWHPSSDLNWGDRIWYQVWMSFRGKRGMLTEVKDTIAVVDFSKLDLDEIGLSLPEDSMQATKWWVSAFSDPDTVLSDSVFTLWFNPLPTPPPPLSTDEDDMPVVFGLSSLYPSPFNAVTTIRYGADRAERIRIAAYDLAGREVALLTDRAETVGWHRVSWNASGLPSGVYFIRLEAGGRVQTAKTVMMK